MKELEAGKLGRFKICYNDYNGLKVTLSVGCFQEVIYDIKTLMPKPLWLLCSSGHYLEVAVNSGLTVLLNLRFRIYLLISSWNDLKSEICGLMESKKTNKRSWVRIPPKKARWKWCQSMRFRIWPENSVILLLFVFSSFTGIYLCIQMTSLSSFYVNNPFFILFNIN